MTTVRTRRSTRARPSDDDLLDAARAAFVSSGFRGTTMSAIAERSNSTKPTLYAHFGDKDSLYVRLLHREADACRTWLFSAYRANAGLALAEQVAADTRALFDFAATRPEGFRLLFGADPTGDSATVREALLRDINAQIVERFEDYLAQHQRPTSADSSLLAAILVGVAVEAARHAIANDLDLEHAAEVAAQYSIAALTNLGR